MKKIAIIHDFLNQYGGAEGTLKVLLEMYPQAEVYTLLHNPKTLGDHFQEVEIKSSFLSRLPFFLKNRPKYLLPLYPHAVENLDLNQYDLIIGSCNPWVKGLILKPEVPFICYMHAGEMRYAWDWYFEYLEENKLKGLKKLVVKKMLHKIRMWDRLAAERPTELVANSDISRKRTLKYYGRDSKVVYPPVEVKKFNIKREHQAYFLMVGRISPYKNFDKIVEVFKELPYQLKIIGGGEQLKYLEAIASPNVEVLGPKYGQELIDYYENCQAFIFASNDEFGITAVEAMACGKPVVALRQGGVKETVVEGETGEFFDDLDSMLIKQAINRVLINYELYDAFQISKHAEQFSKDSFKKNFAEIVQEYM